MPTAWPWDDAGREILPSGVCRQEREDKAYYRLGPLMSLKIG